MAKNTIHSGRLIDHIGLVVDDFAKSRAFYSAVLSALEVPFVADDEDFSADELYVSGRTSKSIARDVSGHGHIHLAFTTRERSVVDRAYAAGLAAGGRDNGEPGLRRYHPHYYAAFLLDPDGNNIEIVHHGPGEYSAASVEFTFE
jgi:catechol 2,3-dioxygenase-like lactoylglutathione lyase family enzyme